MTIRFGSFELDPQRRQLAREGQVQHLTPKAFDLLVLLVQTAPRVVPKSEIHQALWPSGVVTDATLAGLVKEVRRALSDTAGDSRSFAPRIELATHPRRPSSRMRLPLQPIVIGSSR